MSPAHAQREAGNDPAHQSVPPQREGDEPSRDHSGLTLSAERRIKVSSPRRRGGQDLYPLGGITATTFLEIEPDD